MNPLEGYILSQEADQDLDEVFDYIEANFGFDQAVLYLSELEIVFEMIAGNPKVGKSRDEVKQGLRSFVKASHIIFYRIDNPFIRIVRVLHGGRDLPRWID